MLEMWKKALRVIPSVTNETWATLDIVSKWLISSRAAVLVMTLTSSALAGLFALKDGGFRFLPWLIMTIALMLGHACNNLFNDYTDFVRGVDKDNYFRTMYGPQPVAHGLMTTRQLLGFFWVTGGIVLCLAAALLARDGWDPVILVLLGIGAAFVLLYTWPLKYLGLGELSVLVVWGPLMIGGGYYAITRHWSWEVVLASAPYALGVTTVIFGKHIDKAGLDREKKIRTVPVLIGEGASRVIVIGMMVVPYLIVGALVVVRWFTPAPAIVLLALPALLRALPAFFHARPEKRPENFPEGQGGWPLYFAPLAFVYTRSFGTWFILGIAGEAVLRIVFPAFWRPL
jgi:1,4-dihydroxy-2-naphthoate octaprenyltransferase